MSTQSRDENGKFIAKSGSRMKTDGEPAFWMRLNEVSGEGEGTTHSHPRGTLKTQADVLKDFGLSAEEWVVTSLERSFWEQSKRLENGDRDTIQLEAIKAKFKAVAASSPVVQAVDLEALVAKISKWKRTAPSLVTLDRNKPTATFSAFIADLQVGNGEGGGTPAIIERTLTSLENSLTQLQKLRMLYNIPNVFLGTMGDLGEGCQGFYSTQTFNIDKHQRQQHNIVVDLLARYVDEFCAVSSEVDITGCGGNHGECFSADTELLTEEGWKLVTECSVNDVFASLSPKTGHLEYQSAQAWTAYPYTGKLIHFSSRDRDILVTPNHDMWVPPLKGWELPDAKWGKKAARKFKQGVDKRLPMLMTAPQGHRGTTLADVQIPAYVDTLGRMKTEAREVAIDDWLSLAGWYVSEGYIEKSGDRVSISQSQRVNPEHSLEIEQLLKRIGLVGTWTQGKQVRFNHAGISKKLYEDFGSLSGHKKLPTYLISATTPQQWLFLQAYLGGDGHAYSKTGWSCKSKSRTLVNDLSQLCMHVGLRMTVGQERAYPVAGTEYVGSAIEFYINRRIGSVLTSVVAVDYEGMVYCPTVANGLVFSRRNGKIAVTGNSRVNGKAFTSADDNLDLLALDALRNYQERDPRWANVTVYEPEHPLSTSIEISGIDVGLIHGHQLKGGTGVSEKGYNFWKNQSFGGQPIANSQILVMGHWHHFVCEEHALGKTLFVCPAQDGGSDWYTSTTGRSASKGLLTMLIGEELGERGYDQLRIV